jgi:hypothetical protein
MNALQIISSRTLLGNSGRGQGVAHMDVEVHILRGHRRHRVAEAKLVQACPNQRKHVLKTPYRLQQAKNVTKFEKEEECVPEAEAMNVKVPCVSLSSW